jgi:hypothetical protein
MKKIILSLLIVSLISADDFDETGFENMTNNERFEYCNKRYKVGQTAHDNDEVKHKSHPHYIKEQKICCAGIDDLLLSSDEQGIYYNEWDCTKKQS